ncbi:MBL fold metallo-hydrolase [Opitutus terrae]|uniref:Beta-lactamase domain protein n=1 Tax=Opitutus terrae (strain DSM 11246 / JCM 15787 / PB90-1) TaxID=452637 RepID=B1ZYE6_OPITP|nr:MBL fold metallo-hydrolase [Opitutus terrae]ACB77044.1 beta-lactamase domain protein [Opitutus terrae PB90-1]
MKRPLALVAMIVNVFCAQADDAGLPRVIEAETGEVAGPAECVADANAAGGNAVRVMPKGRVTWSVTSALAGRYELNLGYRTQRNSTYAEFAVNNVSRGIGLAATFGDWYESQVIVPLVAGSNTLAFEAVEAEVTLDRLRFTSQPYAEPRPRYELPVISPREARVDLRRPRDLVFLLRRNGHAAPAVSIDGRRLDASARPYAFVDDAMQLTIPAGAFALLKPGVHRMQLEFPDGAEIRVPVRASADSLAAPLLIATLDVDHGKSTVIRLPDGQVAMIDAGKPEYGVSRVIPFLAAHGITHIDHLFITHYHEDHVGGLEALRKAVTIGAEHDYKSYHAGESFELGGVSWFVLNAYESGDEENSRSLSLQLTYHGFVYTDGADTYGQNQVTMMERFPDHVRSHVVYANHHFHGSVNVNYLRRTDAVLFLVSANPAVYARAAFADHFRRDVETYLKAHDGRCRETLLTPEVGNILVRVHDAERWSYETAPAGAVFSDFNVVP